jgi:hypothetical protein
MKYGKYKVEVKVVETHEIEVLALSELRAMEKAEAEVKKDNYAQRVSYTTESEVIEYPSDHIKKES